MKQQIPNILTFSRYVAIPLFIGAWYLPAPINGWLALMIFKLACISDFLDGYLARKWKVESELGRLLDPNADKLLIAVALVMLCASGYASPIAVSLILCRELFISGLREFMAERKVLIHVTPLAKWKTTLQMIALLVLLLGHAIGMPLWVGEGMLWLAAILTLWTGGQYIKASGLLSR